MLNEMGAELMSRFETFWAEEQRKGRVSGMTGIEREMLTLFIYWLQAEGLYPKARPVQRIQTSGETHAVTYQQAHNGPDPRQPSRVITRDFQSFSTSVP